MKWFYGARHGKGQSEYILFKIIIDVIATGY